MEKLALSGTEPVRTRGFGIITNLGYNEKFFSLNFSGFKPFFQHVAKDIFIQVIKCRIKMPVPSTQCLVQSFLKFFAVVSLKLSDRHYRCHFFGISQRIIV